MDFFVTGGAGFIGSHVCERLLRDGHQVTAFDDLNAFYAPALKRRNLADIARTADAAGTRFAFFEGDIADRASLDAALRGTRFDQVIHLAARAGVRPSLLEPALYQRVNVEGTVNVLEAAKAAGVRKFVLASSSSVYGVNAKVPFAETDPIFSAISQADLRAQAPCSSSQPQGSAGFRPGRFQCPLGTFPRRSQGFG